MQPIHERNLQASVLLKSGRDEGVRYDSPHTLGQPHAISETEGAKEGWGRAPWSPDLLPLKRIVAFLSKLKEGRKPSLLIGSSIILVAIVFGLIASILIINTDTQRNTTLTAKFIQALGAVDTGNMGLAGYQTSDVLDPREDDGLSQEAQVSRQKSRRAFFESLSNIAKQPDTLLINVYAPDKVIIWSSNPKLIGQRFTNDEELEGAESSKDGVVASYHQVKESRSEQQFTRQPSSIFIENYIPLVNTAGKVPSVVEFYTAPPGWLASTRWGNLLVWLACSIGAGLIYLGLLSFTGKHGGLFSSRIQQNIDNEMAALLNEVSSVVAHNLRNPLAVVRSSAELALEVGSQAACKNIGDIISQVDRMSAWIKELHSASTSLKGEIGKVDPVEAVLETLRNFEQPLCTANVHVEFSANGSLPVTGHHALLVQILNSLVSNAIDAMPEGGVLYIGINQRSLKRLNIVLRDTGKGMTTAQQKALFRPRCSIKHGGFGIGLMLVKLIMKRFGGHASLTSSKSKGTTVNLCFRTASSD
ncbi:sensor histidine kinase [Pseudomonas alkylphenolica]|uniref:histidine kinase n=1 Tax=Pseudomonas alkylphenolica TaxID=237609 RepID=A0A443ZK53_9PSED|nr:HAMP domain-containing sensor histidine kinase [Pseudomonas alkylphenolica]RWU19177.1 sensor histidine kinase [Pseudomonas alkylphenolica]